MRGLNLRRCLTARRGLTFSGERGWQEHLIHRKRVSLRLGHARVLTTAPWLSFITLTPLRYPCLAAARSRLGSDSHLDCHSLPRRRFATRWGRLTAANRLSLAENLCHRKRTNKPTAGKCRNSGGPRPSPTVERSIKPTAGKCRRRRGWLPCRLLRKEAEF